MSVNKVILMGHMGADPKITRPGENMVVATFALATTEKGYTARNGTVVPDRTEWHNIVMWNRLAEVAESYLKKGMKIYVEGKLRTRSYEDKSGITRYVTEVFVDTMEMMAAPQQQKQPAAPPPVAQTVQQPQFNAPDLSGDLPF